MFSRSAFAVYLALQATLAGCGAVRTMRGEDHNAAPLNKPSDGTALTGEAGGSFLAYDDQQRAGIIGDLKEVLRNRYASWDLKRVVQAIDADEILAAASAAEAGIATPTDALGQAEGNLAFLDRVRAILASFHDSHLWGRELLDRPKIHNGLNFELVGGSVYVVTVYPKMLAAAGVTAAIQPGWRVVSINGVDVVEAAQALTPYISDSSDADRLRSGVHDLSGRTFAYGEAPADNLVFALPDGSSQTVTMPYLTRFPNMLAGTLRRDALFFLAAHHYLDETGKPLATDHAPAAQPKDATSGVLGYVAGAPLAGMAVTTELHGIDELSGSPNTTVDLRLGTLTQAGKTYGILQLTGYYETLCKKTTSSCPTDETVAFAAAIRPFIQQLKAANQPLIIDLRNNGGGAEILPGQLLSMIAKAGAAYPAQTQSFRITAAVRQMIENWDDTLFPTLVDSDYDRAGEFVKAIKSGIAAGNSETYPVAFNPKYTADPAVGGYDQPVVALVNSSCISSCDIQSMIFKASGRVTLIGTPTNGTGSGYESTAPFQDYGPWTDASETIQSFIPNQHFGRPGAVGTTSFPELADTYTMNSEGHPVVPDVAVAESLNDFLHQSQDQISAAIAKLNGP